jgi:hypothetical protein
LRGKPLNLQLQFRENLISNFQSIQNLRPHNARITHAAKRTARATFAGTVIPTGGSASFADSQ